MFYCVMHQVHPLFTHSGALFYPVYFSGSRIFKRGSERCKHCKGGHVSKTFNHFCQTYSHNADTTLITFFLKFFNQGYNYCPSTHIHPELRISFTLTFLIVKLFINICFSEKAQNDPRLHTAAEHPGATGKSCQPKLSGFDR